MKDTEGRAAGPANGTSRDERAVSLLDLDIASAPKPSSRKWAQSTVEWSAFVASLVTPADQRDCGGYVLGRLRYGRRDLDHLINRCAVVLDADKADDDLVERVQSLGYCAAWHTTWSHTLSEPRWRLIFPAARRMTGGEYRATADALMDKLGREQFDVKASRGPVQFMFRPSSQDRATYEHGSLDGELAPVSDAVVTEPAPEPAETERMEPGLHPYASQVIAAETARLRDMQSEGWGGEPWDATTYAVAARLIEIANSPRSGYTLEQAERDLHQNAPQDEGFDERRIAAKWRSALQKVGDRPAELPDRDNPVQPSEVRAKYPPLDLAALLDPDRPAREWVIDGLLPAGASVSLVAKAGSMKSLLLLAAALHIVRGVPDFAGLSIQRQRRVLYVDRENTEDDLAERMRALGVEASDLSALTYLAHPALPGLDTEAGGADLMSIVHEYGLTRGDVVMLDSTQRVVDGPENDADTWRAFYRHTGAQLKKAGLTVVRADNSGKDDARGARGSSSKFDDVDVEWRMQRDGDTLTLRPGKARTGGLDDVILRRGVDPLRFTSDVVSDVVLAVSRLNELGVPMDAGQRASWVALDKDPDTKFTRRVAFAAGKRRQDDAALLGSA